MEIDRINFRFRLEAGALIRSAVRNHIEKLKHDLVWKDGLIETEIYEEKYFLSSIFEVHVKHILEPDAEMLEKAVRKYVAQIGA